MYNVIANNQVEAIAKGLTHEQAIQKRHELYKEKELDYRVTGIGIVCGYAVKSLTRHELEAILDQNPRFFAERNYDKKSRAYQVTNEEYEEIKKNILHYHIVPQSH